MREFLSRFRRPGLTGSTEFDQPVAADEPICSTPPRRPLYQSNQRSSSTTACRPRHDPSHDLGMSDMLAAVVLPQRRRRRGRCGR